MPALQVSKIVDTTAVAAAANYIYTADSHRIRSVQAVYTVTTGSYTLTLQYSNDNATWSDFTTGTAVTSSGSKMWDVLDTKDALYWRVNNAKTSGTLDTLKIYVANVERT
jgi:hypothetical protein